MRDHGRCHDSDAAKVQLSSGQRSLAQAKEFPNSNDPNGPRCVQRSGYYGKGDYPGARVPIRNGARVPGSGTAPQKKMILQSTQLKCAY